MSPVDPNEVECHLRADPLGFLVATHRGIEQSLGIVSSIARKRGVVLATPQRRLLERALVHLAAVLPLHQADEDLLLADPKGSQEHTRVTALLAEVTQRSRVWFAHGELSAQEGTRLDDLATELHAFKLVHLAREEEILYPLLRGAACASSIIDAIVARWSRQTEVDYKKFYHNLL